MSSTVEQIIPLHEEELTIAKRVIETGKVRVVKTVNEREQLIEEDLHSEQIEIRRVPVNRVVEELPSLRQDGDTTIIPVLEEVLVIERRTMLKEEIHITRHRSSDLVRHAVTVREEEARVERTDVGGPAD